LTGGSGGGKPCNCLPQKLLRKSEFEKMKIYEQLMDYNNCNYLKNNYFSLPNIQAEP
jgi:hypothetical protein